MTNLDMQNLNRATIKRLKKNIEIGMPLSKVRSICEKFMLENVEFFNTIKEETIKKIDSYGI